MIELKLRDVVGSYEGLGNLMKAKLPIKAAYHLKRLVQKIEPDMKSYADSRKTLVEQYGKPEVNEKDEPIGMFKFEPESAKQFEKDHDELLDTDIKIDLDALPIAALGESAEVAAEDLLACDKFFKE